MKARTAATMALVAALAVPAALGLAGPAQAAFPGKNGRIAFDGGETSAMKGIFSVRPGGGGERRLTGGNAPAYSADGQRIAFEGGAGGLWIARADGTQSATVPTQRCPGCGASFSPAWSPDGRKLAFVREEDVPDDGVGNGFFALYVVGVKGTGERRLTTGCCGPSWSPDGRLIAYQGGGAVYAIRPDGSGRRRLYTTRGSILGIDWAPDGHSLAVVRSPGTSEGDEVLRVSRSGRRLGRIVRGPRITSAAFSPDGRRVVYEQAEPDVTNPVLVFGKHYLYVVSARGGSSRRLTEGTRPSWQPIGAP
jgi:TolB protein